MNKTVVVEKSYLLETVQEKGNVASLLYTHRFAVKEDWKEYIDDSMLSLSPATEQDNICCIYVRKLFAFSTYSALIEFRDRLEAYLDSKTNGNPLEETACVFETEVAVKERLP